MGPKLAQVDPDMRRPLAPIDAAVHSFLVRPFLVIPAFTLCIAAACGGVAPKSSLVAGRLAPCPPKPHCVSTDATEPPDRHMLPVPFTDAPASARRRVLAAIGQESRARIVADSAGYIRVAIPTLVFRFVDDVEFLVDSLAQRITFRSSARVGFNDWGVNRGRMERIVARLRP